MSEQRDAVVVGGGQSGLATSYCLKHADVDCDHLVLERDRVGERWRSESWDSFTLVTQNWGNHLPGYSYEDCDRVPDDPEAFLDREQVVAFLEGYVDHFDPPLRCGVEATAIEKEGQTFTVETTDGTYETENVVVATGDTHEPHVPAFSDDLPASVRQLHTSEYRNPDQLPEGGVLVVGSGQSGGQVAQELHEAGRDVSLSVGSSGKMPRRYRGKDIIRWLDAMGRATADDLDSPADRFTPNAHFTGNDGGREIDLLEFREDGMTLLGHAEDAADGAVLFADDLEENLRGAYRFYNDRLDDIDAYIEAENIDAPEPELERPNPEAISAESPRRLDLEDAGIGTVVWATGFDFDYGWLPVELDEQGFPVHDRGVAATEGLYLVGMDFLYDRKSGFIRGVGRDAQYVVDHMVQNRLTPDRPEATADD